MKKLTLFGVTALLCLYFSSRAQVAGNVKPLRMGDKLPDTFWNAKHQFYKNGDTFNGTLAAYKGKALLLDFWASWCTSCFKKMPLLDSLQKEGLISVVMVNSDRRDTLDKVRKNLSTVSNLGIPSIYNDHLLKQLFPHLLLPHYLWINADGRLSAATGYQLISRANLLQFNPPTTHFKSN